MTPPRTVAVLGTCVSRDCFNSRFTDYKRWYRVGAEAMQTSLVALMSPPIAVEEDPADGLTDFVAWNVRSDLQRSFLAELAADPPDLLVVDLLADVHFGLVRLPDGRFATDNTWKFGRTAQFRRLLEDDRTRRLRLRTQTEEYLALWLDAFDRFAAFVAEHCPRTRVVLHRTAYTRWVVLDDHDVPRGVRRFGRLVPRNPARATELLGRLEDHAVATTGWDVVDMRGEGYTSDARHPWGPFWLHFTLDYYPRFLGELHAVDLRARLDDDRAARVAAVADGSRERVKHQAAFLSAVHAEQRAAIDALESRGPVRALRRPREVVR
jgi:hypothetical protein